MEVTQEDRQAARTFISEWPRTYFPDFIEPALAEAFARHRQAAELRGAKIGLDAVFAAVRDNRPHPDSNAMSAHNRCLATIRALDFAAVIKGKVG